MTRRRPKLPQPQPVFPTQPWDDHLDRKSRISDDNQDTDDEEDEQDTPGVVVAIAADLGSESSSSIPPEHQNRPVWILRDQDQPSVGVFERYPEQRMPPETASTILSALRTFCLNQSDKLQCVLGATPSLRYGFHGDASLDDVIESFEDDGFMVFHPIREGEIVIDSIDEPTPC